MPSRIDEMSLRCSSMLMFMDVNTRTAWATEVDEDIASENSDTRPLLSSKFTPVSFETLSKAFIADSNSADS
ncbi:hypothetical protein D3C87_1264890 [compost metagenome]